MGNLNFITFIPYNQLILVIHILWSSFCVLAYYAVSIVHIHPINWIVLSPDSNHSLSRSANLIIQMSMITILDWHTASSRTEDTWFYMEESDFFSSNVLYLLGTPKSFGMC